MLPVQTATLKQLLLQGYVLFLQALLFPAFVLFSLFFDFLNFASEGLFHGRVTLGL